MALKIDQVKKRLNSFKNNSQKQDLIWKPTPGKQVVRIVSYKFNPDNPFIELKFHYGLNGKTYLSPDTFNRPDPLVEFASKLKKSGDKEEWKLSRKFEPKLRTFAPIIVRGQESEGVKFWGFGKQVYEQILSYIADPDYGDITDLANGRDIVVEFKTAEETGKQYPETVIRPKPNQSPAVDPTKKELVEKLSNQTDIMELFPEATYEDLKVAMDTWLHPEAAEEEQAVVPDNAPDADQPISVDLAEQTKASSPSPSPSTQKAKQNMEDVTAAFANLFEEKK
jgi:hypothetical protein